MIMIALIVLHSYIHCKSVRLRGYIGKILVAFAAVVIEIILSFMTYGEKTFNLIIVTLAILVAVGIVDIIQLIKFARRRKLQKVMEGIVEIIRRDTIVV